MDDAFLKPYDHAKEKEIYEKWEKSGFFSPEKLSSKNGNFTISMPPPNANGSLHVGHAVAFTLEDLMTRYWRMRGKKTLLLPGSDHAGFETQVVFEKKLEKEGTSRFEILKENDGRERLYRKIWDFTQENKVHMQQQVRELGVSCDWSKETFTLDPKIVDIVYDTFEKLYKDKLAYRGKRSVHWCPKHQTTLSDLEVRYEERKDPLYYLRYGPITLATVRPETKFGDTAIAVHPTDKRYKQYIGKDIEIESIAGKTSIRVIADAHVDPSFGTGAVKVTPAHDADDFAIWLRHEDEIPGPKEIIDQWGRMSLGKYFADNADVMKYEGMKVSQAREAVMQDMQKKGLIEKVDEAYTHNVALCYKCGSTLEPRVLAQWFIDLSGKGNKKIVQPAINAIKKGKIRIIPEFQKKIFLHWMEHIRDWNISRQIVWGIPIPAWYRGEGETQEVHVGKERPKGEKWVPDGDVFDTWFSSGQWPFATMRIHNLQKDFYPTDVMETAYDILFFWVARMIMLGLYTTKKVPFHTVYLHGLVRDKDRQKMSKSKGNVINPLGIVEQYGADALRIALVAGNSPGQDVTIAEDKIRGYRNFSNKLWNIARFVLQNLSQEGIAFGELSKEDKKLIQECEKTKKKVAENIEKFRFSLAAEEAYQYVWHRFADKILESKKNIIAEDCSAQKTLYLLLVESLKMLHPFMPFVTEAIYQKLPAKEAQFLMVEKW